MNQPYQQQPPPPGYGQQPQQGPPPGYQQYQQPGPPQGYGAPPGYGQQPGYGQPMQGGMGSSAGYDFRALYGEADLSAGTLYDGGTYDAVVEESEFGRTRNKDKDQWTVKVRIYGPQGPRGVLTGNITINPTKINGERNPAGMGIMFNELHALGTPVGPPTGPPGEQPWWDLGWTEHQVASNMVGHPCQVSVSINEWPEGSGQRRNRIDRFLPARPGFNPQAMQQGQQPGYVPGPAMGMTPPGNYQPGMAQQGPPQGPPQGVQGPGPIANMPTQFAQRGQQMAEAAQQMQPPQQGPPATPPWQPGQQFAQPPGQQAQQPPQQAPQGPPGGYNPALPPHAQQATQGQPGYGQFTQQGQAVQPGVVDQHTQQVAQQMGQQQGPNGQPPQYSYGSPPQTTNQPVPPGYQPPGGAPPQDQQQQQQQQQMPQQPWNT